MASQPRQLVFRTRLIPTGPKSSRRGTGGRFCRLKALQVSSATPPPGRRRLVCTRRQDGIVHRLISRWAIRLVGFAPQKNQGLSFSGPRPPALRQRPRAAGRRRGTLCHTNLKTPRLNPLSIQCANGLYGTPRPHARILAALILLNCKHAAAESPTLS